MASGFRFRLPASDSDSGFNANTISHPPGDLMNTTIFMEWFDKLLLRLDRPSVIVIDNASYHNAITEESKSPTMAHKKPYI